MINVVTVVLDTSFLLLLVSKPTSGFGPVEEALGNLELTILPSVLDELNKLIHSPSVNKAKAAKLALQYVSRLKHVNWKHGGEVDDDMLSYALRYNAFVATMDRHLQQRLINTGIGVIACSGDFLVVLWKPTFRDI